MLRDVKYNLHTPSLSRMCIMAHSPNFADFGIFSEMPIPGAIVQGKSRLPPHGKWLVVIIQVLCCKCDTVDHACAFLWR